MSSMLSRVKAEQYAQIAAVCIKAIENECAYERYYLAQIQKSLKSLSYSVPRPMKFIQFAKNHPGLFKVISTCVVYLGFLIVPTYLTLRLLYLAFTKLSARRVGNIADNLPIALNVSPALESSMTHFQLVGECQTIGFLNKADFHIPKLSSWGMLVHSYVQSLRLFFGSYFQKPLFGKSLYFFSVLDLYLTMLFMQNYLNKSNQKVFWSNQYDRWAMVFSSGGQKNQLVQHGSLYEGFVPPNKLENVESLYCYDESQKKIFLEHIIASTCKVEATRGYPLIQLTNTGTGGNARQVLFIDQPDCRDQIVKIFAEYLSTSDFEVTIKIHPGFVRNRPSFQGMTVVEERTLYPRADLVIYGNSTLGKQYERLGIETLSFQEQNWEQKLAVFARRNH